MPKGRVIEGRGGFYSVLDDNSRQIYVLRAQKKLKKEKGGLLIGDEVLYTRPENEEDGWVMEILPRKNSFTRPPVANVDCLVIVLADPPEPDFALIDKLLLNCAMMQISPIIVVNKSDLGDEIFARAKRDYSFAAEAVIRASAVDGTGLLEIRERIQSRLCCFSGQSGVGKSSIIRALTGQEDIVIGSLSEKIDRGKQTTRHASLFCKDDLFLFDTPGFSLLTMPKDMAPWDLQKYYMDFEPYAAKCRFSPCLHDKEPDCAVKQMAEEGIISKERLARYQQLLQQARELWRDRYET